MREKAHLALSGGTGDGLCPDRRWARGEVGDQGHAESAAL